MLSLGMNICMEDRVQTYAVYLVKAHHSPVIQDHRRMVDEAAAFEAVQLSVLTQEVGILGRVGLIVPLHRHPSSNKVPR